MDFGRHESALPRHRSPLVCLALLCAAAVTLAAAPPGPKRPERPAQAPALQKVPEMGIEVVGLHLTAGGSLVDLRYRVVDAEKASAALGRNQSVSLVDEAHGLRLAVPSMAYVGSLRQTDAKPEVGKTYFVLFGNAARSVRPGSRVTLVLGEKQVPGLVVM